MFPGYWVWEQNNGSKYKLQCWENSKLCVLQEMFCSYYSLKLFFRIIVGQQREKELNNPMKILVPEAKATNAFQNPHSLLLFWATARLRFPMVSAVRCGHVTNLGQWNMNRPGPLFHHSHFLLPGTLWTQRTLGDLGESRVTIWKEPGSLNDCEE